MVCPGVVGVYAGEHVGVHAGVHAEVHAGVHTGMHAGMHAGVHAGVEPRTAAPRKSLPVVNLHASTATGSGFSPRGDGRRGCNSQADRSAAPVSHPC